MTAMPPTEDADAPVADLGKLRKNFAEFLSDKQAEIEEARQSRRYYNIQQHTPEQEAALAKRGQPAITFSRVNRKIDGLVGVIERMRADPKGFPRTPRDEAGAELATDVLRAILDACGWKYLTPAVIKEAATHHTGGVEMILTQGDHADPDIDLKKVDARAFYYDPRSRENDYSDARWMGTSRWVSADEINDTWPGKGDEVSNTGSSQFTTQFDQDADRNKAVTRGMVRLVDHWFIHRGEWRWCIYAGDTLLQEGVSPFVDEKGRTICKYIMFSYMIDDDGDRYSLMRALRGPQDAMNQHRSKAMWIMNTRQVFYEIGKVGDIDQFRKDVGKPDAVVGVVSMDSYKIESSSQEFLQQTKYYEDAKNEIENYGPNPSIVGTGVNARSGRAMNIMQQSAMAELSPIISGYSGWKWRVYKLILSAAQKHWKAERFLRVTSSEEIAQFININSMQADEFGMMRMVNQLGNIGVDIILDEGPDSANVMGDVFDTIQGLAQNHVAIPPQVFVEMSSLPKSQKDKILKLLQVQPDPAVEQKKGLELQQSAADIDKTKADTAKALADAGQKNAMASSHHVNTAMTAMTALPMPPLEQPMQSMMPMQDDGPMPLPMQPPQQDFAPPSPF